MSDSPWISVKDKLPSIGVNVLVTVQWRIPEPRICHYSAGYWLDSITGRMYSVSHWMPIPALIIDPDVYEASLKTQSEPELPL